jgi:DUF218 domain
LKTAIIVLGADLADGGAEIGPETILRCNEALRRFAYYLRRKQDPVLVMSPGMSKEDERFPKQVRTMAELMAHWFLQNGAPMDRLAFQFPASIWGTRAELRTGLGFVSEALPSNAVVEVVSSDYHKQRIEVIASRIQRNAGLDVTVGFRGVFHPLRSTRREILKTGAEFVIGLLRPGWYRLVPTVLLWGPRVDAEDRQETKSPS